MARVHVEQGDITTYEVEAVVNAANNDLILGGGLAGAIARKGGPTIQAECDRLGPIKVGEAAITGAGNLPAKFVIHAASMALGGRTTAESLRRSLKAVFEIVRTNGIRSLALPAIGTGIAGFPLDECARITFGIIQEEDQDQKSLTDVYVVLFDHEAYEVFRQEGRRYRVI